MAPRNPISTPSGAASPGPTSPEMNRRTMLGLTGAATFGAATGGGVLGSVSASAVRAAAHGPYNLKMVTADVDGMGVEQRCYNGQTPGPLIEAMPGDVIPVELVNALEQNPDVCEPDMNKFHRPNTTNFHTHGLHVSPERDETGEYDSDNVLLEVLPDGEEDFCGPEELARFGGASYRFDIPGNHPSGTFWYHAHRHGSTDAQVAGGLAGPLIIRDEDGDMPEYIANAKEQIFMIQLRDRTTDDPPTNEAPNGTLTMVHANPEGGGTKNPKIQMYPGEVQRWRIINAAPRSDAFMAFGGADQAVELYQIAYDGITFADRREVQVEGNANPWENPIALAPGNRTDFLVRIPPGAPKGTVRLTAFRADDAVLHEGAARPGNSAIAGEADIEIEVTGSGDPVTIPADTTLPAPSLPDVLSGEPARKRNLVFAIIDGVFTIDGKPFDGEVQQSMDIDTMEEWTIKNGNPFTHPFHIHVNPFFVTHIDGVELGEEDPRRRWQDTMAIPPQRTLEDGTKVNGSFTMRSAFTEFTGKFVIHCHILDHEDQGMMQVVEVVSS